jgi:phage-related baseplate assembly protein
MANNPIYRSKDVRYLGRDFDSLKKGLVEFVKNYYPNTYNDFNEASPGMMFLELAAYVGDTLNYYIDSQFKENFLLHATEQRSLMAIASALGYKPKLNTPSSVDLDIFQLLPASGSGNNTVPDLRYGLKIASNMVVRSTSNNIEFLVPEPVDFSINTVDDSTEVTVYSIDGNGAPNYYLARKTRRAISATTNTTTIQVTGTPKFFKFQLTGNNLIGITSVLDSAGNTWNEVPYLAQDTIFEQVQNTAFNDPDAAVYSAETPYLLKLKRVPRRFITRVVPGGIEVQFGSGVSSSPDEELLATPENIGLNLPTGKIDFDPSIDPQSPIFTAAYGIAPSNTTLTVTYLTGGGVSSNAPSNTINEVTAIDTSPTTLPVNTGALNASIVNSIAVNNRTAAGGGRGVETVDEIRQNALAQFSSQNRAVTREDYIIRAYAMPNTFGSVAKVYITPDEQANLATSETLDTVVNPLAMNMYILGYDVNKNLTTCNRAVKENLKTYLSQYRMLTDSINLRDGFVINIGVDFDIIPLPSYNSNETLLKCIAALKDFFNIDKWQVGQPIILSEIFSTLVNIDGVQTVKSLNVTNLYDSTLGYSDIAYSIPVATRNGIIYPSIDPSIFEVKYPDNDIKGRIATF